MSDDFLNPEALGDSLKSVLHDDSCSLREREEAVQQWLAREPRELNALVQEAEAENSQVRQIVASVLGSSTDPAAVRSLVTLLGDPVNHVRNHAERSLLKQEDVVRKHGIGPLLTKLRHAEPLSRAPAARILGAIQAREALEPLMEMLQRENDWLVRMWTASALGDMNDVSAFDLLVHVAQQDEKNRVRAAAVEAIAKLKQPKSEEALKAALDDDDEGVRKAASEALSSLGMADDDFADPFDDPFGELDDD